MSNWTVLKYGNIHNLLIHQTAIKFMSQWYLWEGDLWQKFLLMQLNMEYLHWDWICIVIVKKAEQEQFVLHL